ELWKSYLMFYDSTNTDQYEFEKLLLFEDSFIPWQKIDHPVYGEVEIGGFGKNFGRLHPGFLLESDAHRNAAFCIYNAFQTPKLEVENVKVRKMEEGLTEVTATVVNKRMLPTHSATNLRFKIDPPNYVFLDGGSVIAGMIVVNPDLNITTDQQKDPRRMEISNISGYQKVNLKWIVKGGGKFTVRVESVKGGRASAQSE
ncbi:MAG TPA: hypothetical protein VMW32_10050, partial [Bacteroidales bacterium]|nr:hypothetical protein [Bacteroidales bacterium]